MCFRVVIFTQHNISTPVHTAASTQDLWRCSRLSIDSTDVKQSIDHSTCAHAVDLPATISMRVTIDIYIYLRCYIQNGPVQYCMYKQLPCAEHKHNSLHNTKWLSMASQVSFPLPPMFQAWFNIDSSQEATHPRVLWYLVIVHQVRYPQWQLQSGRHPVNSS